MTDSEKLKKIQEYLHDLGWYSVLILDMNEVKEHLKDIIDGDIDDERLRKACRYVASNMDVSHELINAIEWASDIYLSEKETI